MLGNAPNHFFGGGFSSVCLREPNVCKQLAYITRKKALIKKEIRLASD